MFVFINIVYGLYEHWFDGLAICGLGCSATAQFYLTAQPSSDTIPGHLISKNRLK